MNRPQITRRMLSVFALALVMLTGSLTSGAPPSHAGTGGTSLRDYAASGLVPIIRTCITNNVSLGASGCQGPRAVNIQTWYGPAANCTHAYPQNDFDAYTYGQGFNEIVHLTGLNCGFMVAYLGPFQSGAGAVSAHVPGGYTWLIRTGRLYQSVSLHNRG